MNSNPSSSLSIPILVIAALVLIGAAAPVAAVDVDQSGVPDEAAVGEELTVTFELTELYENAPRAWTLNATTELENASWEIRTFDNAGDQLDRSDDGGNTTEYLVDADRDVDSVEVTLRGTVPEIEEYTYDPEERFVLVSFDRVREGGGIDAIDELTVHHYTPESDAARTSIDEAQVAVEGLVERGGDPADAQRLLGNAIDAYESAQFDLAAELSSQAADEAGEAEESVDRQQLTIYAAVGLVAVAIVAGLVYWFRSRRGPGERL